ncbi:hypothetical protein ACI8AK_02925 [Geodermatophilus sp. SYSU D00867]
MAVLLVDAANVVGARPDGWWRNRAGATTRLLRRLAEAALPDGGVDDGGVDDGGVDVGGVDVGGVDDGEVDVDEVVVVVEGAAREVPAPDGVRLVRAAGSGDDALAAEAAALAGTGRTVLAVTADRGLRARLPAGTDVRGPGWLLGVLDRMAGNRPG